METHTKQRLKQLLIKKVGHAFWVEYKWVRRIPPPQPTPPPPPLTQPQNILSPTNICWQVLFIPYGSTEESVMHVLHLCTSSSHVCVCVCVHLHACLCIFLVMVGTGFVKMTAIRMYNIILFKGRQREISYPKIP